MYEKLILKLGVELTTEEKNLIGNKLLKVVLQRFLPLSSALFPMIISHSPSPLLAQQSRIATLYGGDLTDKVAKGIRNCDPNGPLVVYLSQNIRDSFQSSKSYSSQSYVFGRVFSGTLVPGQLVNIVNRTKNKSVRNLLVTTGQAKERVNSCCCGNVIALEGFSSWLPEPGVTLTTEENTSPILVKPAKEPFLQVTVDLVNPEQIPLLLQGMTLLPKSDRGISCKLSEDGEFIIRGSNETHLRHAISELERSTVPLRKNIPFPDYSETVSQLSDVCYSRSANSHNRISARAEPLDENLVNDLESVQTPLVLRPDALLVDTHNWKKRDVKKIWGFNEPVANCLVLDATKGVQNLDEIKDSILAAFRWCTKEGALCGQRCRGIRYNLVDFIGMVDAIHRGPGQIIPCARRAFYASQLSAALLNRFILLKLSVLKII